MASPTNARVRRVHRSLRAVWITAAVIIGFFFLPAVFWTFSLRDPAPAQNECEFNSVSRIEFQQMLAQAHKQRWTVWPGLSNGIFMPSDRTLKNPTRSFEGNLGTKVENAIRRLVSSNGSEEQLAAAHAIMRSIKAEYVSVFNVPNLRQNGELVSTRVLFNYLMPQIRYAPLCIPCLFFWNTSIAIVFDHNVAANTYRLDRVNLLHSGPKYEAKFDRLPPTACPSFPQGLNR